MNKIYRIVWSASSSAWVVASEFAKGDARSGASSRMTPRRRAIACGIALFLAGAPPAFAQSYWDGTDTNANANGGNGTWSTGATNWDNAATGGANVAWANGMDAVFGGSGTVTLGAGGVDANSLRFDGTAYTFNATAGNTLTLSGTAEINAAISGQTQQFNVAITGSSGLIKSGLGGIQLNNANTYTGVTKLQEGVLSLNNASALGTSTSAASNFLVSGGTTINFFNAAYDDLMTLTGGTVLFGGNSATWSGTPTLTANTILSLAGTLTLSGNLADTAGFKLSLTNNSNNTLSGTNTYTGQTRLTNGTLTVGTASLPTNSNLAFDAPSDAFITVPANFARTLGTGDTQVQWIRSGGFMSTTSLVKTINLGTDLVWGSTPSFLATSATLDLAASSGYLDFQNNLALPLTGTTYTTHIVGTLAAHPILSGVISGPGNLLVTGGIPGFNTSMLELSGANTFSGQLILQGTANEGNVLVSGATSLPATANLHFNGGASATGSNLVLGNGDFTDALGTGADQVQWTGNGGFSATGAPRFVDIGNGATLTWNTAGFVPTNSWLLLATAGDKEIDFRNDINLNGLVRTIVFGAGGTGRLTGDLSNGGVLYRGGSAGSVEGNNNYTGTTTIGSGSGATNVSVTTIGNGGVSGNLGAATNAAANLLLNSGAITYKGAGETTNRNLTVQTAGGSLLNDGTGVLAWNGVTGQSGTTAFTLGGTSVGTLINRVDGLIQNGGATLGVDKSGVGTWQLANSANTYTGPTRLVGGVLEATSLGNGGVASSIGASTNAAANLVLTGGTLRYVGATNVTTDRNFQLSNNSTIESSGAGVLNWSPTTGMAIVATNPTFTLGGTNTGANSFNAPVTNHTTASNVNGVSTKLTKTGIGTWHLNGATDATYTGNTTLIDGLLIADTAKAITGGFAFDSNTTANTGYTGLAAPSSLIVFNAGGSDGGVLGLSTANNPGGFRRSLSTAGQAFNANSILTTADDTFIQGVNWVPAANGGFAAMDGTQVVNIGNTGATMTFGNNGFLGGRFILGATSAAGTVDFQNALALANAARTFDVRDGSASVDAILSGLITAGGAGAAFNKIGTGTLALTANNTSSGGFSVQAGTLQIGNGGATGAIGNNASVSAGATLAFDRNNASTYSNLLSGAGTLRQQGTGTTTLTNANTIGATQVTNGTLSVNNSLTTSTLSLGAGTMRVGGTMQAGGASRVVVSGVAGTAGTLQVDSGGTLRANGTLGDGNDTLRVAGTLDTTGGLTLGAGDDAYDIVDGSNSGDVDGGTDNDTATATLALDAQVGALLNFETLNKAGAATLNFIGPTASSIANVNLNAGRLRVQNGASVNGPAIGAQTTTIANGARLSVDLGGSYGCGTGDDTLSVAGLVDGAGTVSQCGGNDTLTLRDGATLSMTGAIDGGTQTTFDRVLVDAASALTFDGARVTNYEQLTKQGIGTLTLAGNHAYSSGVSHLTGSEVIVGGALDTSAYTMTGAGTLTVTGSAMNAGSAIAFTGDTAAQKFDVRASGTLMAGGTLGDGSDIITLAGTLDTGLGFLALGSGNDRIDVLDGGTMRGEIDGDAGTDQLVATIGTNATIETVVGFESLNKSGIGTLTLDGGSANTIDAVTVAGGQLDIAFGTWVIGQGNTMTVDVGTNATLDVAGMIGCNSLTDTWTISGTVSGGGQKTQCDGDDTLVLRDGASITGTAIDGGAALTGDTVVIDNAASMTTGDFINYETLRKQNTGAATLAGNHTFANGIDLLGGALTLANTTLTDQVDMVGGTMLQIDGNLRGNSGLATTIDGDAGVQTVTFAGTGNVHADLGDGADLFEVMADVRTDGGAVLLGAGNDMFVLHEGANLFGTIDAGAGLDTFNQNVTTTATIGTALGFEALAKSGIGTLVFDGTAASDFQQVTVSDGQLRVASGASFITPTTVVGTAGTLRVDGSYGCGTGNDTLDIAGTFEVNGTVDQCGGDDTFTLRDGATLLGAGVVNGGTQAVADTFVLDIAGSRTLGADEVTGYEILSKQNIGDVTLVGSQAYDTRVEVQGGNLSIDGTLTTAQMDMAANTTFAVLAGGRAQGLAGSATTFSGSNGIETVFVDAGAMLVADGDLGDGNDILDLAGTLDTNGGTLSLGAGDDEVRIYDTSDLANAAVDAGAGNDLLDINLGTGVNFQLGSTTGFESLGKSGDGTMQVDGTNTFVTVRASDGLMHVASTGTLEATTLDLESAGTLRIDGALRGTSGGDTFTLAGALTGAGSVDLGAGNDTLVFNDGADSAGFTQTLQGGVGTDTLEVDIGGNATLAATSGFETLQKQGVGALMIAGDNVFDSVALDAGTLRVQAGADVTGSGAAFNATLAAGTTLDLAGTFGCNTGNDAITLDGAVTGAGALQQCAGDDVLRVQDGVDFTGFTGAIDGGANNDTVQLDTASAMQFGGDVVNYETLQKLGTGVATLTGNTTYATRTAVDAGTLQIAGTIETAQLALSDNTTLRIDGSASGLAASEASLVGSAGANTLTVGTNAVLRASGSLGDGDDTLTLQDGARIIGAIDGGAGLDTFNTDIATTARFGAATGFEALDKTGVGVLEVAGTAVSDFARVTVSAGTLDVQAGGAINGSQTTTVAANAIFNVSGAFNATAGADVLDIAGAVSGASTLFLDDGDDVLRLRDGASLTAIVDGGLPIASDSIVIDAANALAFDATRAINFESLQKLGAGAATVTGNATYTNVTLDAGALSIAGQVDANAFALADDTILQVDGAVSAAMNGSSGINTIRVGAGATLTGAADLGAGDDVLDVAGRLDTSAGTFQLGDGDDRLVVHDTTQIVGAGGLDAGAGNDMLDVNVSAGNVVPVPALAGFESLGKSGLGTLELNGAASFIDVAVMDGLLHVASGGTMQAQSLQVDGPAQLRLDGGFAGTAGDDSVSIAGRIAGAGAFALGDGDDTLALRDGADLSAFASTLDAGAGTDTLSAEIATQASLAPSINFETLSKTGLGVLSVGGAQAFDRTYVGEGTLDVAAGATLASRSTLIVAGATLDVAGAFNGTAGDDDFESAGIVRGALVFAAGNDRVLVTGGPFDATQVDGGAGTDTVTFRQQALVDSHVAALRNFERMTMEASTLALSTAVTGVDVLELDDASTLTARTGASLAGTLVNGGTVRVDDARLSIGRDYIAGPSSILHVMVSPGRNTAGGLSIAGNVTGATSVVFDSDGSSGGSTNHILIIDSPNDTRGDDGAFTSDAIVRLAGSPYAWSFAQADDNRWYLGTDATTVVPEVNGYAALPAMALDTLRGTRLATFGHLDAIRGSECNREQARDGQLERRDCSGAWISAGGIETRIGEGGGLAYSGDSYGLHIGVDGTVHEDAAREVRVGGFAGQVEGNYWTRDHVNVRLDGPVFGAYGELRNASGAYFNVALMHQRNDATVATFDGFKQGLHGDALALVHQAGWQLDVGNGWSLEPQAQVGITRARWDDVTDASGKPLTFVDDTTGELRAALRVERNGGMWRPWFTVALEDTIGESKASLSVQDLAMPGEMPGQRWTFDAGIEANLRNGLSVFGAMGVRRELNGPKQDSQQARIGLRWAW